MNTFPSLRIGCLCAAIALLLSFAPSSALAQFDLSGFLPPGVSMSTATPQQISEAVLAAAQQNPDAAAEIAAGSLQSVYDAGRYTLPGSQDGKQSADPDGSSNDPTLDEWANTIADAAKQGNPDPAMAPKIDSAVANTLTSLSPNAPTTGGTTGGTTTPPPMIPPGGGGGTTTSSTGASN